MLIGYIPVRKIAIGRAKMLKCLARGYKTVDVITGVANGLKEG